MREEVPALTQDMGMCNENPTSKQTLDLPIRPEVSRLTKCQQRDKNVTQAVRRGNLSSGTHPAWNVPADGNLVSLQGGLGVGGGVTER